MIIDLKKIKTYYLNPESFRDRHVYMEKFLSELGMNYERHVSVTHLSPRQNNYSFGSIEMIEKAIKNDQYPFLLLDDDVNLITDLPQSLEIPNDCDVVYLGASTYEMHGIKAPLRLEDYDESYYRIYSSLSSHALLITNNKSATNIIEILKKSLVDNQFSDIYMAHDSEKSIHLTPKDGPYFYQTPQHTKEVTHFLWKDVGKSYL